MAIDKKFAFFRKRLHYDNEVNNNGVPATSINFIDDTKEIITHGSVFAGLYNVLEVQPSGNGLDLDLQWHEIPQAVYNSILTEDGTYIIQIQWGLAIYTGIFPYKDLHRDGVSYSNLSAVPIITTDEEIVLTSCGNIPDTKGRLYLKLAKGTRTTLETVANTQVTVTGMRPSLFIACSKSNQQLDGLTFKFRRII